MADNAERTTVPVAMRPHYDELVERTDAVCRDHLDEEYAALARRLAAALCRKRPSPVTRGRVDTWACGILYALGSINFLFDRSQQPYLSAGQLCGLFGIAPSTGGNKAAEVRKLVGMRQWDADWFRPSQLDQHPTAWFIEVNGLIVDARSMSREIQEEALRRGYIPYLPELPGSGG